MFPSRNRVAETACVAIHGDPRPSRLTGHDLLPSCTKTQY
jgi:hypothetical protein